MGDIGSVQAVYEVLATSVPAATIPVPHPEPVPEPYPQPVPEPMPGPTPEPVPPAPPSYV